MDVGCRRCSSCEGLEHHWLPDTDDDGDGEPMMVMVCKHCEATREYDEDDDE